MEIVYRRVSHKWRDTVGSVVTYSISCKTPDWQLFWRKASRTWTERGFGSCERAKKGKRLKYTAMIQKRGKNIHKIILARHTNLGRWSDLSTINFNVKVDNYWQNVVHHVSEIIVLTKKAWFLISCAYGKARALDISILLCCREECKTACDEVIIHHKQFIEWFNFWLWCTQCSSIIQQYRYSPMAIFFAKIKWG